VEKCFDRFEQLSSMDPTLPYFYRKEHIRFLERSLRFLSTGYECLDSSRPWLCYWILQSAHLLNFKFSSEILADVVQFLSNCRSPLGGKFFDKNVCKMNRSNRDNFHRIRRWTFAASPFGSNLCSGVESLLD
jgi:prenyltransferase beta subunit